MARKYLIETYGCQMNVHDSERMAGLLEQAGYEAATDAADADLVVINTCSVRERAEIDFAAAIEAHDGDQNAGARSSFAFRNELIRDRQLPDAFAGGGEDRVGERRRDRRYARLPHTAQRPVEVRADEMHANVARRDVHARHLVIVEIALFDAAVLERDLR